MRNNIAIIGSNVFYAICARAIQGEPMGVVSQSPASKDVGTKAEESPLLEATTKND
jgi:hypothetical protein